MIPAPRDGCGATRANLEAFVLGETEPGERAFVESHLASCAACRREHAEVRFFLAKLSGDGRRKVPSSRLRIPWIRRGVAAAAVIGVLWLASRAPRSGLEVERSGEPAGASLETFVAQKHRSKLLLETLLEAQRPDGTWAAPHTGSMARDVTALAALALVRAAGPADDDRVVAAARRGLEKLGAPAPATRRLSPSQRLSTAVETLALVEGAGRYGDLKERARARTAELVVEARAVVVGRSAMLDAVEAAVFETAWRGRLRVPGLEAARDAARARFDAARTSSQAASVFGGLETVERDRTVALLNAAFGALADPAAASARLDRALEAWSALSVETFESGPLEAATHLLALTARP